MNFNKIEQLMNEVQTEMEKQEVYDIVNEVEKIYPRTIVEIGVKHGGTLNIWKELIPPNGVLIGIDKLNIKINKDSRIKFIKGDSLNYKTYQDFLSILNNSNNKEIDFLFIDGGHVYREAKSDFYTYGWHVRKNGLIAIHDIYLDSVGDTVGSSKHFWEDIKKRSGRYWEVVCEISRHTGTGIVRMLK